MLTAHAGLLDADDQIGIDLNDFAAFIADVEAMLEAFGVAQADRAAILSAFTPFCADVLAPAFKDQCLSQTMTETVEHTGIGATLPDNGYDGTLASMLCHALPVPQGMTNLVAGVTVTVGLDHAWVGDLTIKLVSPKGTVLTLVSRPGLAEAADDGIGAGGDSSDVAPQFPLIFKDGAANDPEWMGLAIGANSVVCKDDLVDPCEWFPNPGKGPGTGLADFVGEPADGVWQLCVGDGGAGDGGSLDAIKLVIDKM